MTATHSISNDTKEKVMGRVNGKVAIVTGGARGQGAEHARLLAAEGAAVVITDVLDEQGEALAAELSAAGHAVEYFSLDVRDSEKWDRVAAYTVEQFGKVDVLVNNAGIVTYSAADECSDEEWDRTIAINQTGVFYGIRAIVPHMKAAGGGSIINVSSVYGGVRGVKAYAAYGASKAAVVFLTKSAAMTYGRDGIRANAIAPGALDTAMLREEMEFLGISEASINARLPIPRLAHPSETSPAVVFLASDESGYITGTVLAIDGGSTV